MEESQPVTPRLKQSKRPYLIAFSVGVALTLIALLAYGIITSVSTTRTIVSCHTPTTSSGTTQYCVYHLKKPSLLGSGYSLRIGPSENRGLVYVIPYPSSDVTAAWSGDSLRITMPGTSLSISSAEYVDQR